MEEGEKKKVKIKFDCIFSGHNIKQNGIVSLKLKTTEQELHNTLQLVTCIGKEMFVGGIVNNQKIKIGKFFIDRINIDKNAQSTITIVSTMENIDCNSLPLITKQEEIIKLIINCK